MPFSVSSDTGTMPLPLLVAVLSLFSDIVVVEKQSWFTQGRLLCALTSQTERFQ